MLGRSIFAGLGLGASAFLLPTALIDAHSTELSAPPVGLNVKQSIVSLPCSECAFSTKQKEKTEEVKDVEAAGEELRIQGGANSVIVNLTISEDGKKLQINGETIYPIGFDLLAKPIYVSQVASSASIEDIESGNAKTTPLEVTGSGVSVRDEEVVSPEGHIIVPIRHIIFELEQQPVSLDEILIKLLKTSEGELFIAHISIEQHHAARPLDFFGPPRGDREGDVLSILPLPHQQGPPPPGFGSKKACRMPKCVCKLKHMIEEKLMGIRQRLSHGVRKGGVKKGGCHGAKGNKAGRAHDGKLPTHIRPQFLRIGQDGDDAPRHHGPPHHMRPQSYHDGHHHEHHKHHFMHSFTRGLTAVLIPTMMGVAVGLVVSLFGLCVGRLISYLWIKLYREGRRGYESVRLEEDNVVAEVDLEKKSFIVLEQSEPLPIYEEAPSYEEAQNEQK